MKKSLNQIVDYLQWFQYNHNQLHAFSFGELNEIANINNTEVIYPLLHVQADSATIEDKNVFLTLNHLVMDLTNKSENNTQDVLSDTLQICNDLHQWVALNPNFHKAGIQIYKSDVIPFVERFQDSVAGWNLRMTYKIQNTGICDIPFYSANTITVFNCTGHEPIISFGGSFQTCENSFINITADNIAAGQTTSATTFVWAYAGSEFYTGSTYFNAVTGSESAGRYTVTATNNSGCSSSSFIDVVVFEKPVLQITNLVNESSPGAADGSYTVEVTNSQGGFYLFTDGTNTNFDGVFTGIGAGDYVIEVTDQNSCTTTIPVSIA